jgi:hypothetical protein
MAAVVQWARAHGKHISIFVARHDTEAAKQLDMEQLSNVLRYGDDSRLPTPGLFFYAQVMPVVVTHNQLTGLKLVKGPLSGPSTSFPIFPPAPSPSPATRRSTFPPRQLYSSSRTISRTSQSPGSPEG